jgi:hypothetical protein
MVRSLFLTFSALVCLRAQAQYVNVNVLRDDPVNVKCFRFLYEPLYFTTWKPNGNAGMAFGFLVNGGRVFTAEMTARFSYSDHFHVKGDNSIPKFNNEDILFHFNFGKQTQLRSYKIKISNTANGYTYINQDLKRRVCFGIRAGISILGSGVDDQAIHSFYIKGADTNYLSGKGSYSALMAVGGWSVKFVHCALVSLDGYRSAEGGCSEFFFDAMPLLALNTGTGLPAYDTVGYDVHVPVKQKLGMRMGWRFYDPARSNFSFGVQFGTYAGPDYGKDPSYFMMSLGFMFGDKIRQ